MKYVGLVAMIMGSELGRFLAGDTTHKKVYFVYVDNHDIYIRCYIFEVPFFDESHCWWLCTRYEKRLVR